MLATSLLRGIAFLLFLQWVSTLIINALGIPFPPTLLGMLILTALLCYGIVPAKYVEDICEVLVSKMGMLFLPAGVSCILYFDVIAKELVPIVVMVAVTSVAVLISTAYFVQVLMKKKEAK